MEDDALCMKVAAAIISCDSLLVFAGAGMSADSGLPVYAAVGKSDAFKRRGICYDDLCFADCAYDMPELFYGFWGASYNAYCDAVPHDGYHSLRDIANSVVNRDSFFCCTSNVDGLFKRAMPEFSDSIYEVHGSVREIQCTKAKCARHKWAVPHLHRYSVHDEIVADDSVIVRLTRDKTQHVVRLGCNLGTKTELLAIKPKLASSITPKYSGFSSNYPLCVYCGERARPHVKLYDDDAFIHNQDELARYTSYMNRHIVKGGSICLVEVGVGDRVPTLCRMIDDVVSRCDAQGCKCTVIRINATPFESKYRHCVPTHDLVGPAEQILVKLNKLLHSI